jgi:hypothetical protein
LTSEAGHVANHIEHDFSVGVVTDDQTVANRFVDEWQKRTP